MSYASGNAAVAERIAAAWKLAVDRSHLMAHDKPFIVPVVIDEVSQADAQVPERFSELQWTRLPASRHALLRSRAPSTVSAADPSMPVSGPAPTNPSAPARAAGATPEKSIAVLPFVDMSERHDQAYFSGGLAEELLDQLAQVPDLKIASRTSATLEVHTIMRLAAEIGECDLIT